MNKLQTTFCIIGCGNAGRLHATALNKLNDDYLTYCYDIDVNKSVNFAREHKCICVNDLNDAKDVTHYCVCTPHSTHMPITEHLLLHTDAIILVEKPFTIKHDTSNIWDNRVYPIMQNRYMDTVKIAQSLIKQNYLGKIILSSGNVEMMRTQEYYNKDKWRGTLDERDSVLINQAIHTLDILCLLNGGLKDMNTKSYICKHDIEMPDTAVCLLEFYNGSIGSFVATTCSQRNSLYLSILGTHGRLEFGGTCLNKLTITDNNGNKSEYYHGVEVNSYHDGQILGTASYHDRLFKDVIENKFNPTQNVNDAINIVKKILRSGM